MQDDLYFLQILIIALKAPDPRKALEGAFQQIEEAKDEPRYQTGYLQFQRFMKEVVSAYQAHFPQLVLQRVSGSEILQEVPVTCETNSVRIPQVIPGDYLLLLDTGLLLWEGELGEDLLLYSYAHPGEDLPMAADTGDFQESPSKVIELLQGELVVQIFPGLESGTLEIRWSRLGGVR